MRAPSSLPRYFVRRAIRAVLIWLVLTFVVFVAFDTAVGQPCLDCGRPRSSDVSISLKWYEQNQPLIARYFQYMSRVLIPYVSSVGPGESAYDDAVLNIPLAEGRWLKWMSFGPSFASRLLGVNAILRDQLPISLQVIGLAFGLACGAGVAWGVLSIRRQPQPAKRSTTATRFTLGLPLVLSPLVILIFAVSLNWFPPTGWGTQPPFVWGFIPSNLFTVTFWRYAILPCGVLGLGGAVAVAQLTRSGVQEARQSDRIRVAHALGMSRRTITLHYVLRPALAKVLSGLGWILMTLVAADLIVEWFFGIPGLAKYFLVSITNRDSPVIQGLIIFSALILLSITVFFDVLCAWLDPRVRSTAPKSVRPAR